MTPGETKYVQKEEPVEVSYTILEIDNDNPEEMLQEFATVINVQLMMADGQKFPFIPFIDFDND